jgi:hypothetical protein
MGGFMLLKHPGETDIELSQSAQMQLKAMSLVKGRTPHADPVFTLFV